MAWMALSLLTFLASAAGLHMSNKQVVCTACPACGPIQITGTQYNSASFDVSNQAYFHSSGELDGVSWDREGQRSATPMHVNRDAGSFALTVDSSLGQNEYSYKLERLTTKGNDVVSSGKIRAFGAPQSIKIGDKTYSCKVVPRTGNPPAAPASVTPAPADGDGAR